MAPTTKTITCLTRCPVGGEELVPRLVDAAEDAAAEVTTYTWSHSDGYTYTYSYNRMRLPWTTGIL